MLFCGSAAAAPQAVPARNSRRVRRAYPDFIYPPSTDSGNMMGPNGPKIKPDCPAVRDRLHSIDMKLTALAFLLLTPAIGAQDTGGWQAGAAKIAITPREPIWMAGFGFRKHPSE